MTPHELPGHQAVPDHFFSVRHFIDCKLLHKAVRHSRVGNLKRASMEVIPWFTGAAAVVIVFLQASAAASAHVSVRLSNLKLCGQQWETDFLFPVFHRAADDDIARRGHLAATRGHDPVGVEAPHARIDVCGADVLPGGLFIDE